MGNLHASLGLIALYGDYATKCLLDTMLIGLNSEKPEVYEWSLKYLKEYGKLLKDWETSGVAATHNKEILAFLEFISNEIKNA